ncbi:DNA cytosine methyltransferase [Aureibaculum luteum]|uniref:DNA cytosine methyltransferase n=1 Tax=Aureibaculum luteum TaxID=1548456 RepID=UPI000E540321|nr:DNA cytosine methyltransferase [Aureibaculum luteum]
MNYSEIKKYLEIERDRKFTNEHAYITHYLQNSENEVATIYKKKALDFIASRFEEMGSTVYDVPFPPPKKPKFKFIDLFAGIGGFRIALQNLGGKCVFSSEIDNAAKITYESNFGEFPFGDIRDFTDSGITDKELNKLIPNHDILAAGFPCQPFSLAGVSARNFLGQLHGFSDEDKGNLFFDIARIVDVKRPNVVFLENVKNFKGHDGGNTYSTVKKTFEDLGYSFYSKTINSAQWVPQKRQRFYMICFKKDPKKFEFPSSKSEFKKLKSILEDSVSPEYTISNKLWEGHINRTKRNLERGTGFTANVADIDKPSNTLVARYGKDGKECLIPQMGLNPRKLTPRECARLQGFPESYILPRSNAASYKQFGNSVAVPVIEEIGKKIIDVLLKTAIK